MSKTTLLTDDFVDDLENAKIIVGFRTFIIQSGEYYRKGTTKDQSNDYYITLVPTSTNRIIQNRMWSEIVNLDMITEKLMINTIIPTITSKENYIVFTYLPLYSLNLSIDTYNKIEIFKKEQDYLNLKESKIGLVFKWDDANWINILSQLSNSTLNLFVELKHHRVQANFMSIPLNNILHSHETNLSEDFEYNLLNLKTLSSLSTIQTSSYELVGVSGYEYQETKELTDRKLDFPFESYINSVKDDIDGVISEVDNVR